jgi:hypothetical protein
MLRFIYVFMMLFFFTSVYQGVGLPVNAMPADTELASPDPHKNRNKKLKKNKKKAKKQKRVLKKHPPSDVFE